MFCLPVRHRLIALTLGMAAVLGACGGGDALPPGATPLTAAPDTTAPTVSIASGAAGSTATGPVTFTFTFSENIGASFTVDDVTVVGGTKGAFATPNGTTATLVVTPMAAATGTIEVQVAAARFSDLAGNLNVGAVSTSQAYNTVVVTPVAQGSGSTGTCTASPCLNASGAGLALVAFGGLAADVVADPGDAANTAIRLVKVPTAETWAGATLDPSGTGAAVVPAFGFSVNRTVTLRVLSPAPGRVIMIKVESSTDPTVYLEAQATTTLTNQWETLTFNFAAPTNGTYDPTKTYNRVSIFPSFGTQVAADTTYYVDELNYTAAATTPVTPVATCGTTAPTCAPATVVPAGALTIYTEAAQVANFIPNPDWGQSPPVAYSEVTIAGNKSLRYTFTAPALYEGLDWAANPVNASGRGKLHIDLWSADISSVRISIISAGRENAVTQAITAGSWNTVDIDLAQYTVPDKSALIQIKLDPNVGGTLYVDNIYFWDTAPTAPVAATPVAFSTGFGAGGLTVQGGAFGGYSGSSLDGFNCSGDPAWCGSGGSFAPGVAAGDSSFYYYYQTPSPVTALYAGVYIQAPGLTTGLSPSADTAGVSISGLTNMRFTLGQNAEWFSSPTNNFGVILTLGKFYDVDGGPAVAPCNIKLLAVVTPTSAAATTYTVPLSSFGIIQTCNVAGLDVAGALALSPLSQVDFQAVGSGNPLPAVGGKLVGANMSVGTSGSPAVYPSTIALGGGITFE